MLSSLKNFVGFSFIYLIVLLAHLQAQSPDLKLGEVSTVWPGVNMQVISMQRISNNRLLVLIRIAATAKAPSLTLIGAPPIIPPNATKEEIASGNFLPEPFSLESSTMIDEQTGTKYPVLAPQPAATGQVYRPGSIVANLTPGQATYMSMQFAAPPVPPSDELGRPTKQTVSLILTKASGPITKIPLPEPN